MIMKKIVLMFLTVMALSIGVQSQNTSVERRKNSNENPKDASSVTTQDRSMTETKEASVTEKKGCFRIASLSLSSGMNKYRTLKNDENDDDFDYSSKYSHQWKSGGMGFMKNGYNSDILTRNFINLEMGLNPYSKKLGAYNLKQEMTIGLFYSGSDLENTWSVKYASTPGDTFLINTIKYQTDSVTRVKYSLNEKANVMGARVEYLFKTDPEKRFSVFTGVGLDFAYAITAQIRESYTTEHAVVLNFYNPEDIYEGFEHGSFYGKDETKKTSIKADPTFFTGVSVPFGINMRLCKKKEIWNQMNLFLKGDFGLEAEIVANHQPHFNPFIGTAIGFRFNFK